MDPQRSAVLVDFDGSIAAIVDDPTAARVLPVARDALAALVGKVAVVGVISGRPIEYLVDALDCDGLQLVGQYGLERLVDGVIIEDPRSLLSLDVVAAVAEEAEKQFPDLYVERKGRLAVTLHWRRSPIRAREATEWATAQGQRLGLALYPTRMAIELRPSIPMDKGTAVEELCAGLSTALFAGDDYGDLTAFDALDRLADVHSLSNAIRIAVRSDEEPAELVARSDIQVDGPSGLADLLVTLAHAL
ncbi:MAG: trehalose-phosphatase [Acidimicrobiia bacterium]|nr:trehalose-phosphatase [Acidimicrobiia bacterium]